MQERLKNMKSFITGMNNFGNLETQTPDTMIELTLRKIYIKLQLIFDE